MHPAEVAAQVAEVVHQSPRQYDLPRSRWWLAGVRQAVPWLANCSLATVCKTLQRQHVCYRRGRRYVHSPDPEYRTKVAHIAWILDQRRVAPQHIVTLYADELTYYRRATVAPGYLYAGSDGPRAAQGLGSNTQRRIAGCLDVETARLFTWQRAHFDRRTLIRFYQEVMAAYPDAQDIYLIQDNWPVHFHPDVLAAFRETKLHLVALPTYAPWLNPIEKVWRKLYAEVLHLHPWVNQWEELQAAVQRWLAQYTAPSLDLLRYVGLCPD